MSSPTELYVDAFAHLMESQLAKTENRAKGNAEGWRAESVEDHVAGAEKHLARLKAALARNAPAHEVRIIIADAANRLMMTGDTYAIDRASMVEMALGEDRSST